MSELTGVSEILFPTAVVNAFACNISSLGNTNPYLYPAVIISRYTFVKLISLSRDA